MLWEKYIYFLINILCKAFIYENSIGTNKQNVVIINHANFYAVNLSLQTETL